MTNFGGTTGGWCTNSL